MNSRYIYWVEESSPIMLCRRLSEGGHTEYLTSHKNWTTDPDDSDIVNFRNRQAALNAAGEASINPAEVR